MRIGIAALVLAIGCAGHPAATGVLPPPTGAPPAPVPDALGARTIALVRRDGYVLAPTRIDDHDAGDFLLDTGASSLVVDERVADALELPTVDEGMVAGVLAEANATLRQVQRVTAAGLALEPVPTIAIDLVDVDPRRSFGGLIGFPTLGEAPFTIDFVAGSLTIHDPARFAAPANARAELLRVNQLPYVEATLEGNVEVWLLLDSGQGSGVVLWQDFVKQHPDVLTVPQKRWGAATGVGGGTQVMISEVRSLQVFGEQYGTTEVVIQDQPQRSWHHPRVAGRIGMPLLDRLRLTIHPTQHRIWIERP